MRCTERLISGALKKQSIHFFCSIHFVNCSSGTSIFAKSMQLGGKSCYALIRSITSARWVIHTCKDMSLKIFCIVFKKDELSTAGQTKGRIIKIVRLSLHFLWSPGVAFAFSSCYWQNNQWKNTVSFSFNENVYYITKEREWVVWDRWLNVRCCSTLVQSCVRASSPTPW